MNRSLSARVKDLLKRRHLKETLTKVALSLSCLAIFMITYMLVSPVLTQEWEAICGMEEHTHTEECYEDVLICGHETETAETETETAAEAEAEEAIETETEAEEVVETEAEAEEAIEAEGHIHTDSCYTVETVTKYKTVTEEITETVTVEDTEEREITDEEGNVTGTETVVTGTHEETRVTGTREVEVEDGTEEVRTLTCTEEETAPVQETVRTPAPAQKKAEQEVHVHDESCYERRLVCELEEHTHEDQCYQKPGEEIPDYACGFQTEHVHKESCWFEDGELKCTIPEHLHSDECLAVEQGETVILDETFTAESEDGAVTLDLSVSGEIVLPVVETSAETEETGETAETEAPVETGFRLILTESEDQAAYEEYETLAAEQGEVVMVQVLKYALTYNEQEVDLSGCEVAAQITPTEAFEEFLNDPGAAMAAMTYGLTDGETGEETCEESEEDLSMSFNAYTEQEDGQVAYSVTQGLGANPQFTVQYYANLERAVKTSYTSNNLTLTEEAKKGNLVIIDTDKTSTAMNSNKNSGGLTLKNGQGIGASPMEGNKLAYLTINKETKTITAESDLTEIYQKEVFEYQQAPGLKYFNIVLQNEKSLYTLKEIWVQPKGGNAQSTEASDWTVYTYTPETRFTNRPETAAEKENYILIEDGAVIRLVYDPDSTSKDFPANFYDYDISNGAIYETIWSAGHNGTAHDTSTQGSGKWYTDTRRQGINSNVNYGNDEGTANRLAFGNANSGTAFGAAKWNGNALNTANRVSNKGQDTFGYCTFGLVQKLDKNGHLVYGKNVKAPKLFNDGSAKGKTSYENEEYSLNFDRVGDTYTLKGVNGTTTAKNLNQFNNPKCGNKNPYTHIWTNNFWPMDSAPSYGTTGHDMKFGNLDAKPNRNFIKGDATKDSDYGSFPESDDGQDHNSYFGMQYSVTFDLSASYVGPLEYYFFGDDDMWVFLDGKLVCDIGGVHSSVGEFVNLWDYIDRSVLLNEDGSPKKVPAKDEKGNLIQTKDKNGNLVFDENGDPVYEMTDMVKTFTLNFFYTERGASGSTCWMQFTLPTVVGINLESILDEQVGDDTGSLSVEKVLEGVENTDWFTFQITGLDDNYAPNYLLRDANGNLIPNETIKNAPGYDISDQVIGGTSTFRIRAGDVLVLRGLPKEAVLTVTELDRAGYNTEIAVNGQVAASQETTGEFTIQAGERTRVVFTNISSYELPSTGGAGTTLLYAAGIAIILTTVCLMYMTQRRGRKVREGGIA